VAERPTSLEKGLEERHALEVWRNLRKLLHRSLGDQGERRTRALSLPIPGPTGCGGEGPIQRGLVLGILSWEENRLGRLRPAEETGQMRNHRGPARITATDQMRNDGAGSVRGHTVPYETCQIFWSRVVVQAGSPCAQHSLTRGTTLPLSGTQAGRTESDRP
jgi:hypothetical protein